LISFRIYTVDETVVATKKLEVTREGVKLSDPSRESARELLHITSFLLLSILPYSLRFEDHLMRISGQQISADVPMRLNVSAVAPRKGIRQRVCHQAADTPHAQLARACKSGERPRQLLIFDNNWSRPLPQSAVKCDLRDTRTGIGGSGFGCCA